MATFKIIMVTILFFIAAGLGRLSFLHFKERGPLLNNAVLFITEEEREKLDKKPYYRQSAIVFALLGAIFLLIALAVALEIGWLYSVVWLLAFAAVAYAIASSVKSVIK